ncbi:MAG: MobC family plasmid mobilization relaxosome protein [Clostridiales bacterium]|nr:MobC family plasmid mobilization relaxosome protein [Clostridiales bacterium]
MRTRKHFVGLWLNDQEHQHLVRQCSVSGLTASGLLRQAILGIELRPRPPDTYAALLRELSAIGNNVNQIAHNTNASKTASQDYCFYSGQQGRGPWPDAAVCPPF